MKIQLLVIGVVALVVTSVVPSVSTSYSIFNSTRNDSAPTELSAVPLMNSAKIPAANLHPDAESNPGIVPVTKCYLPLSLIVGDLTDFPQNIGPQTVLLIRQGLLETNFAHICTIIGVDLYAAHNGQFDQNKPLLSYKQPQKGKTPFGQAGAGTISQAQQGTTPATTSLVMAPLNSSFAKTGQPSLKAIKRTFLKDSDDAVSDNYFELGNLYPGSYALVFTVAEVNNTSSLLPPFVTKANPISFNVLDPNDPAQNGQLCRIEKNEEDTSFS